MREQASTLIKPSADAVTVSKYQFFPSINDMTTLCASALEAKVGKFNIIDMKIDHSRNVLTGVSSCKASL